MLSRNDPRVRRAIDQFTQNFESANERTQEGLYSFTHAYLHPCFASIADCVGSCTVPCCSTDEDRRQKHRGRARAQGQAEFSFDFYDDWEQSESDALLGIGDEEGGSNQPRIERQLNYGTRQASDHILPRGIDDNGTKSIPSSSYFGFMDRMPFKIGTRGLKYQPSIADLQDHPVSRHRVSEQEQPLLQNSDSDDELLLRKQKHRRLRSETHGSGHTADTLSSRGDIFPSEDEMDDAVPLDDEFALALERRTTGHATEDGGSGRSRFAGTRSSSHLSITTISSKGSSKRLKRAPATIEDHLTTHFPAMTHEEPETQTGVAETSIYTTSLGEFEHRTAVDCPTDLPSSESCDIQDLITSASRSPQSPRDHTPQPAAHAEGFLVSHSPKTPFSEASTHTSFNAAALPRFH